jgi:hypothetical protein
MTSPPSGHGCGTPAVLEVAGRLRVGKMTVYRLIRRIGQLRRTVWPDHGLDSDAVRLVCDQR